MKKHLICGVDEGSIAEELEIEAGDFILAINDKEINDIFDSHYLVEDDYLEVLIEKKDGEEWLLEVEKDYDEDLGLSFGESLMDAYKSCHNKCIFCFIDQNPPNMRETIYFKDDDTRLSFLQGNYVTLTNLNEKDIERIIEYKLAPINISVHSTSPELRCRMLHNRFADRLLKYMDMLYEAEIPMNAQIVLCKNINDGKELERTISDLLKYAPVIQSLSVVPVGLTKYRDGLYPLEPFNSEDAKEVIAIIEKYQDIAMEKHGYHFVHASDEWYINAGYDMPDEDSYDGYIQLENGVGMTRLLLNELRASVDEFMEENKGPSDKELTVSTISGVLVHQTFINAMNIVSEAFPKVKINTYKIVNNFFGEKITVTGLLTGGDIISQLKDKDLGDVLFIPENTLKADEDIFLDDVTLEELQKALQVPVIIVKSDGADFLEKISETEKKDE
ncbi:MAG: DUF512 domain-containing protein [Lachnospiraceae bacterium]|nr:DUF512 domain-containing protein [Lachnospiraceae bacterium]